MFNIQYKKITERLFIYVALLNLVIKLIIITLEIEMI